MMRSVLILLAGGIEGALREEKAIARPHHSGKKCKGHEIQANRLFPGYIHADRGGVSDQGFSLISFTGLPPNVSPQPFASGLR